MSLPSVMTGFSVSFLLLSVCLHPVRVTAIIPISRMPAITLFPFFFLSFSFHSCYKKTALLNKQCLLLSATGYHFTGSVALRRRLSSVLPQMFPLFYHVMFFLVYSFLLYSKIYSKISLHTSIHPHAPATSSSSAIVSLTAL